MSSDTKFGTFDDLLQLAEAPIVPIVEKLRARIFTLHKDSCEVVRLGDRAATYGLGPKKMSEGYCYILPHKSWVNLGFYYGASLPDPYNLMEGSGKNMRHIKMRSLEDTERPGVVELIESAIAERRSHFNQD